MIAYKTVKAFAEDEFTEKRSRFICAIAPVTTQKEASDFVAARKSLHHDARHTVYAYILREGNVQRFSDDGEPQGTGGMPVLEVIRREGLVDVCVAITRYFGGVLLGAGGLTRAYAGGASLAVAASEQVTMRPCAICRLKMNYSQYNTILRILPEHGADVDNSDFGADVMLTVRLPEENVDALAKAVTEATAASVSLEDIGRIFGSV